MSSEMIRPVLTYPGKRAAEEILNAPCALQLRTLSQAPEKSSANRIYCGDNFAVLNHLRYDKSVAGKVRLVYIDPPYSTGSEFRVRPNGRTSTISSCQGDQTAYSDHLKGAEFVEFLRRRLILLRELLSEDGSIYVHIDSKMGHYLKVAMDEIFGPDNFRSDISRIKCNPKNFLRKGFGNVKDCVFYYTKSDRAVWNEPRQEMTDEDAARLFRKTAPDGRRYTTTPLHAPGETRRGPTGMSWKGIKPPAGRHWRYPPGKLSELDAQGLIEWSSSGNPRKMIFADDVLRKGKKLQDVWDFKDPPYPSYPTEKNLEMLETIVRASSNPGDIVLDCFCGSGSTLAAAQINRRHWIGVDQSPVAVSIARARLEKIAPSNAFSVVEAEVPADE